MFNYFVCEVSKVSNARCKSTRMVSQGANGMYYLKSVVHSLHDYKHVWIPVVGEQLVLKYEEDNNNDQEQ